MRKKYDFIDQFDEVLERLGGNEQMLLRLLKKFQITYENSRESFLNLMKSGNIEEAYRLVHSLKGVSANLGIERVYKSATALEQIMKLEKYSEMQTEQDVLFVELETVLDLIKESNT